MKLIKISNIGNTCYFSSSLQVLYNTRILNDIIIWHKNEIEDEFTKTYIELIEKMRKETIVKQEDLIKFYEIFIKKHKYYGNIYQQHDSNETMLNIIDYIYEDIEKHKKEYKMKINYIEYIFDNKIETKIKCERCNHEQISEYNERNICIDNNEGSIEGKIEKYFEEERLEGYKCDKCKEEKCKKTNKIKKLANILIITINSYDKYGMKKENKIQINKEFKIEIKENKKEKEYKRYKIYNVICHHGTNYKGHYTTSIIEDEKKYIIDDDCIYKLDDKNENLWKKNAYVLMCKMEN